MNGQNINLETKTVGDIAGVYVVKSYQRGYRWDVQVRTLLDDIWENGEKSYCLQPVVVRKDGDRYELVDGQQRLTTLYILLKYIQREYKPKVQLGFTLEYENRPQSRQFIDNMDEKLADTDIDFYFMYNAYKTIADWFSQEGDDGVLRADDMYRYLHRFVKIIWYEVDESTDPIALFTRLNIGRIPLTNSELIKALFLNRNEAVDKNRQIEISMQWDDIERRLHNPRLWYFLCNTPMDDYATKIDLLFESIAGISHKTKEKYATFFYFDKLKKKNAKNAASADDLLKDWDGIRRKFQLLTEWYENHDLYHKIGYLIATGAFTIHSLMDLSVDKTKTEFTRLLDAKIAESISLGEDKPYMELTYENGGDQAVITRILLLHNVMSVARSGGKQWFPFDEYKVANWSLEHIHAQKSEGLNTKAAIREWLTMHREALADLDHTEETSRLISEIDALLAKCNDARVKDNPVGEAFKTLYPNVVNALSVKDERNNGEQEMEAMHTLTNLALLKGSDNAALSNATFDVKRKMVIRMDKQGDFIPFCTRMVFLKYYTPSRGSQIHFWSRNDREAYRENMNEVLRPYLAKEI